MSLTQSKQSVDSRDHGTSAVRNITEVYRPQCTYTVNIHKLDRESLKFIEKLICSYTINQLPNADGETEQ